MSQNLNFFRNLQLTDDNHSNLNTFYDHTNFHSMTNNNIFQVPFVTSPNTVNSASQYCSYASQSNSNGQQANHFVNLPNSTTFNSSQSQVNQCNTFKFEIPGFEIIIRPKSNQITNLNNLNTQYHSSMDSYSPVAVMPSQLSQSQNYIDRNFVSGNYVNSVNDMNTDNLQYQIHQQQNIPGYNNFRG
jgi:hypothetical protein